MTRPISIISHRCRGYGPENSEVALRNALSSAVDAVEIDCQITQDRKLVVHHNARYRDAAGKRHTIKRETLAEAERNGRMSLDTALALFKKQGRGKVLDIDVKKRGGEAQLVGLVRKHGLEKRVLIVSWIAKTLEEIHHLDPGLQLSFSFAPKVRSREQSGWPIAPTFLLPGIVRKGKIPLTTVNLQPVLLKPLLVRATASIIRRLQKRGLNVVVVNADTLKENERLIRLGVYGTMTNDAPGLLKQRRLV